MTSVRSKKQWITLAAGHFFMALGIVGAFLPIIPTVPFLLLAAFFYNKGHPQFHHKVMNLPKIGPILRDWEQHKIIRSEAKVGAIFMIMVLFAWPIYFARQNTPFMVMLILMSLALITFIALVKSK
ncbi:MAG: YbaN family protein [Bdellovibrio sp.]|nr:YbaN family protein [Bdellovibrio sp.]